MGKGEQEQRAKGSLKTGQEEGDEKRSRKGKDKRGGRAGRRGLYGRGGKERDEEGMGLHRRRAMRSTMGREGRSGDGIELEGEVGGERRLSLPPLTILTSTPLHSPRERKGTVAGLILGAVSPSIMH